MVDALFELASMSLSNPSRSLCLRRHESSQGPSGRSGDKVCWPYRYFDGHPVATVGIVAKVRRRDRPLRSPTC